MSAANFSQREVTEAVDHNEAAAEARTVAQQAGIPEASAERLVSLAASVREEFAAGKVAGAIRPRELVTAA